MQDFKVYTAPSLEALSDKVSAKESVWCGWHNFLGQHSCVARLSPFGPVHVAVEHNSVASKPLLLHNRVIQELVLTVADKEVARQAWT